MTGKARHYFPGSNTPEGFFSYYHHIVKQREAGKIWYIKGGPGVGKSTFMKKIGESLLDEGYDVDFLHCSSDSRSLDCIFIKNIQSAIIDGTSPHIQDPKYPGAVDTIINLGDYWHERGIRRNRLELIKTYDRIKGIFDLAYFYLAAAGKMYDALYQLQRCRIKDSEIYKIAAGIINDELAHHSLSNRVGITRRQFASAFTPEGRINYISNLIHEYKKIYLLNTPLATGIERIPELFMESAVNRGFDCEAFYCPMKPGSKLEHLLVPDLSVAIITSNAFHSIVNVNQEGEIIDININEIYREDVSAFESQVSEDCINRMTDLIDQGINCLKNAKKEHDLLETFYIPNMDFNGIEALRRNVENDLRDRLKALKSQ